MAQSVKPALHGYWRSSATYRVRIALNYKNISYDTVPVNLLKGEQKGTEYSQLNPMSQVPTLVIDGENMTQSLSIIQYLEDVYPEPSIIPKDPKLKQKAWMLAEIINSGIQPVQNLPILNKIKSLGGDSTEHAKEVIIKGFTAFEQVLKQTSGRFCVGDQVTIADVCLIPQIYNSNRFKVDLGPFENIRKVVENCQSLDAFIQAKPENQPDAVPE